MTTVLLPAQSDGCLVLVADQDRWTLDLTIDVAVIVILSSVLVIGFIAHDMKMPSGGHKINLITTGGCPVMAVRLTLACSWHAKEKQAFYSPGTD